MNLPSREERERWIARTAAKCGIDQTPIEDKLNAAGIPVAIPQPKPTWRCWIGWHRNRRALRRRLMVTGQPSQAGLLYGSVCDRCGHLSDAVFPPADVDWIGWPWWWDKLGMRYLPLPKGVER